MVNTDAFKQTRAYTTLTTMYNRMLKGDNAILEEEVSDYFKSLVGLKTSRLKKSLMTSSGIKGPDSYTVDRLVQNILPTQRRYAFELAGTELDALITMFKRPEYAEAYKKFNEYVLILSHYERIQKATNNANVKSYTFTLWDDLKKKSEDFLKERGSLQKTNN